MAKKYIVRLSEEERDSLRQAIPPTADAEFVAHMEEVLDTDAQPYNKLTSLYPNIKF